jgi:peptide/nickel transport system substrate-binding protein
VETPDERTARLVFREPYSEWRDLLTAPILPRHVYEGRDPADLAPTDEPVGSGPFLLKSRTGNGLGFLETPRYWVEEPPLPNLERLEVSFSGARETADDLVAGRADFGFFATPDEVPASGDLLRAEAEPSRVEMLVLNARRLESRETRRVLVGAVDRRRIAQEVGGDVSPARSVVPAESFEGRAPAWEVHEPRAGRNDGARGGPTGDGESLEFVYPADAGRAREEVVRSVVSDLSDAGFDVEARPVPRREFHEEVLGRGDFDLALYTGGTLAELGSLALVLPPQTGAEVEETLGILDAEERSRRVAEAQEEMAEEASLLPLFVWSDTYSWSSTLSGPRAGVPYRGLGWNAREWGFFR